MRLAGPVIEEHADCLFRLLHLPGRLDAPKFIEEIVQGFRIIAAGGRGAGLPEKQVNPIQVEFHFFTGHRVLADEEIAYRRPFIKRKCSSHSYYPTVV